MSKIEITSAMKQPRERHLYGGDTKTKVNITVSPFMHNLITSIHKRYPSQERSGIAKLEKIEGGYMLTDIVFGDQQNSSTLTEITDKGAEEVLQKIFERDPRNMGKWICWLHSHHHMETFWSGTDHRQKQKYDDGNRTHFFHVVTNHRSGVTGYKGALTIYQPYNIEFDAVVTPLDGEVEYSPEQIERIEELKNKMADELSIFDTSSIMNRQSDSLNFIAEVVNVNNDSVKDEVIEMLQKGAETAKKIILEQHEKDVKNLIYGPHIRELEACVNKRPVKEVSYTYHKQGTLIGDEDGDDEYTEYDEYGYEVDGQRSLQEQLKLYTDLEIRERIEDLTDMTDEIRFYGNKARYNGKEYWVRDLVDVLIKDGFISQSDF